MDEMTRGVRKGGGAGGSGRQNEMRLREMHLIDFTARPWLFPTGNIIFIASHSREPCVSALFSGAKVPLIMIYGMELQTIK